MVLRVMFLEDLVRDKVRVLKKLKSAENPADCLTKAVSGEELEKCLRISGCWPKEFGFDEVVQMIHVDSLVAYALLDQVEEAIRKAMRWQEEASHLEEWLWSQWRATFARRERLQRLIGRLTSRRHHIMERLIWQVGETVVRNTFIDVQGTEIELPARSLSAMW